MAEPRQKTELVPVALHAHRPWARASV